LSQSQVDRDDHSPEVVEEHADVYQSVQYVGHTIGKNDSIG